MFLVEKISFQGTLTCRVDHLLYLSCFAQRDFSASNQLREEMNIQPLTRRTIDQSTHLLGILTGCFNRKIPSKRMYYLNDSDRYFLRVYPRVRALNQPLERSD